MVKILSIDYIKQTEYFLENIDRVEESIDNTKVRLREINSKLDDCFGEISYDGQPKGSGGVSDQVANLLINKEYVIDELMYTQEKVNMLYAAIERLGGEEKAIIEKWYLQGYRANDICKALNISDSTLFRIKKEALRKIAIELHGINVLFQKYPQKNCG